MSGSILVPLSVRLSTSRVDKNITNEIQDLSIRNAIPGGYSSASFTLSRPLDVSYDDIQYYARVYVYDARNGNTVWEGRLEDPGRSAGEGGEQWSITAVGPSAHARDRNFPIIYVDSALDRWHRSRYSTSSAHTESGEIPNSASGTPDGTEAPDGLFVRAEQGTTVSTAWQGDWIYRSIFYAGQLVARLRCEYVAEGASANYQASMWARVGDAASTWNDLHSWSTSVQTMANNFGTGIPTDTSVISLRAARITSSVTADDKACVYFYNIKIRAAIKNLDGTDNLSTSGYNVNNIDPVEVVTDLLGRYLPLYDGPNAYLIGSGVDIYQLAYPDGTTADDIFNDIMVYDPGFYWAAWETNKQSGRYRFEYRPWPTDIRYEADTTDGFEAPQSAGELFNRVHVRWRDGHKRVRNMRRTQYVKQLSDAGIIREAYIDISDEMGDATNAAYVGDNFLLEHQYPLNAGTLTIARPILDNYTGRMVEPWELKSGNLIRVRGVLPRRDSLNPISRDGVTIFKTLSAEYNAADNAATLELDTFSRTVSRALATLDGRRYRKM